MRLVPGILGALLLTVATIAAADVCYQLAPYGVTFQFATVPAGTGLLLSGFDQATPSRSAFGSSRPVDGGTRVAFSVLDDGLARHITALVAPRGLGPFQSNDGLRGTLSTVDCSGAPPGPPVPPIGGGGCRPWIPAALCPHGDPRSARVARDEPPPPQFTTGLTSAGAVFDANDTKVGDVLSFDGPNPVVVFDADGARFSLSVSGARFLGTLPAVPFDGAGCTGTAYYPADIVNAEALTRAIVPPGLIVYLPDAAAQPTTVLIQSLLLADTGQCAADGLSRSVVPARPIDLGALFVPPFSVR